ncbi:hypothetical protein QQF64_010211 [Cirrhinus molitorella]|uniref:Uncharacterized protein n=1 Tax=Cirrhinus molitorella TaxID=172907 RepID=A0ABR3M6T6_9TELE
MWKPRRLPPNFNMFPSLADSLNLRLSLCFSPCRGINSLSAGLNASSARSSAGVHCQFIFDCVLMSFRIRPPPRGSPSSNTHANYRGARVPAIIALIPVCE